MRLGGHDVHAHFAGHVFRAFKFNQHAFAGGCAVDVGSQVVGSFDALEAAHADVFAQFGNHGLAHGFNGLAIGGFHVAQSGHIGRVAGHYGLRCGLGKSQKAFIFGHKVGFAVYFNQCTHIAFDGISQHAFGGCAAGQFTGFSAGFDAQDFFGFFHVAIGFNQGFFAFHHAQASGGAQVAHHFCGNCRHFHS